MLDEVWVAWNVWACGEAQSCMANAGLEHQFQEGHIVKLDPPHDLMLMCRI